MTTYRDFTSDAATLMSVPVYDSTYQNTDAFNAANHLFSDTTGEMDSTTVADALLEAYNHGGATVIQGDTGTGAHTVDIMDYDAGTSHASGQVLQYRFCMGGSPVLSIRCEADGAGGINESSLGVYFDNTSLHVSYSPDYQDTDYTAVSLTEMNTLRTEVYRNQTAIAAMLDSLQLTA